MRKVDRKDFHLADGREMCKVKWLKSRVGRGFIFHANIPALYLFWWKLYWLIKELYIQHAWMLIKEKQNNNQKYEGWKNGGICENFWQFPLQVWLWRPGVMVPWYSGYRYCTVSFNKIWTLILCTLKPCSRCVGDLQWWESLAMVPVGSRFESEI